MGTRAAISFAFAALLSWGTAFAGEKQCPNEAAHDDGGHHSCCCWKQERPKLPPDMDRWVVGLHYHYIDADGDERNTEDSNSGFRLTVGKPVTERLDLEVGLGFGDFDVTDSQTRPSTLTQDEISLSLDALYYLHPHGKRGKFQPYLELGVGLVSTEDSGSSTVDSTDFQIDAGIGARWILNDNWSLRSDLRHRFLFWDDDAERIAAINGDTGDIDPDEFIVNVGLVYAIGDAPRWPEKPAMADDDGDSIDDANDRCPGTPAGTPVDQFGCPIGADADGDGVVDSLDKCPNTPAGTKVDANGCPLPETVVIYFAFDSSALTADAKNALNRVAASLTSKTFVIAIANGHADSTGTEEYNVKLSERRAAAVANYLVSKGVAANAIRQRAYGETRPAAANDTAEGRAKNRRVEINLLRQ